MKLKRREQQLPSEKVKVTLEGNLADLVNTYIKYYEVTYQEKIAPNELLIEMIKSFMSSDREFSKWRRNHSDSN